MRTLPFRSVVWVAALLLLFVFITPGLASAGGTAFQLTPLPLPASLVMLAALFTAFICMTRYGVPIPLAMGLLAMGFLALSWGQAEHIALKGFQNFSEIAIVFTAVAIPAHLIDKSRGFEWAAAGLGHAFGKVRLRRPRMALPLLVTLLIVFTYVLAGLMHNITSILIMTPIIIRLCDSYRIPSRWLLCGALIASNLGGFSTRWGDTPNIIEAKHWHLVAGDFWREILPVNMVIVVALIMVVFVLTRKSLIATPAEASGNSQSGPVAGQTMITALGAAGWDQERNNIVVDRRLLWIGLVGLFGFIISHVIWNELSIALGALTILLCVLFQRAKDRLETLTSLGFEVYLTFGAIFMIAGCVKNSWVGETLQQQIQALGYAPWAISITGYLGTTFTEAGSWVTAVAEEIARGNGSHATAWALGAGICAGSSSILTSASAGIILWEQSGKYKDHAIGFKNYLVFGLGFSLFMLLFYSLYFTFLFKS